MVTRSTTAEVNLQIIDLAAGRRLSTHDALARRLTVRQYTDDATGDMMMELRARLVGTTTTVEAETQIPADWWEAVKERWAPQWALRRWPVRWHSIPTRTTVTHCCPHIDVPDVATHVRWVSTSAKVEG